MSLWGWITAHLPALHSRSVGELSPELRNVSHKIANEAMAMRAEVILAVGGHDRYEKEQKFRAVTKEMMDRLK